MSIKERALTLGTTLLAGILLAFATVGTALAEAVEDGDGFDGDELALPLIIGGVVVVGLIVYLVGRRRTAG